MTPPGLLQEVLHIYSKEMRDLVRDRHTLIYSFLLPLFLYPAIVWGALQVAVYSRGMEEHLESRVQILGPPEKKGFEEYLETRGDLKLSLEKPQSLASFQAEAPLAPSDEDGLSRARDSVLKGSLHALVVFDIGPGSIEHRGNASQPSPILGARILYSAARNESEKAKDRLEKAFEDYRKERFLAAARRAGKDESFLDVVSVDEVDLSSRQEIANYIASLILPLLMMVMTAMGALYPALDATVGEKERSTLETTLVCPARRQSIVLGKYLAVVSFSLLAFFLNLASMGFTLSHLRVQLKLEGLSLGLDSAAVILGAAVLLALFLSAVMMLLGFMARSFKEGQAYLTPVYLVSVMPALLVSSPDVSLTPVLASVPLINLALLFREALKGRFPAAGVGITMAFSALYAGLSLACAARLLKREEFATGGGLSLKEMLSQVLRLQTKSGRSRA